MRLYLYATTNVPDLSIDFIEVRLKSGKTATLDWDESEMQREGSKFSAWYRGVCIDKESANGRLNDLEGMEIIYAELYSEVDKKPEIEIRHMDFDDEGQSLEFSSGTLYSSKEGDNYG
jgi:hypothetical protein